MARFCCVRTGCPIWLRARRFAPAVERYAPDYDAAIHALIDAANHAGGKDNITVVLVAAPGYLPEPALEQVEVHRPRRGTRTATPGWLFLVAGVILGLGVGLLFPLVRAQFAAAAPRTLTVGTAGINAALALARSGDTVIIPEGRYKERVQLREGVALRGQQPATVTLMSPDGGPVVMARKLAAGSIEGVWIQGDLQAPVSVGIDLVDSSPTIANVRISGAQTGIVVRGASAPLITLSDIANNLGAGIDVGPNSSPKIENNLIAANGNGKPGIVKPGVDVHGPARPVIKDNGIVDNSAEPIWIHRSPYTPADYAENFFGKLPAAQAIRAVSEP